jgi:hypothetical protein
MAGEEYDKDLDAHGFRGKLREKAKAAAAAASKSAKKVCPQTRPLSSSSSSLRSPAHGSIKRDSEREKNRNVIESEIKRVGSLRERERARVRIFLHAFVCMCVCLSSAANSSPEVLFGLLLIFSLGLCLPHAGWRQSREHHSRPAAQGYW